MVFIERFHWITRLSSRLVAVLMCGYLATTASAQLLFQDTFSYPDGAVADATGSRWKVNYAATGRVDVASGRIRLTQGRGESVRWDLASPLNSGAIYARMQVTFTELPRGNGNFFAFFRQNGVDNLRGRLWVTTNGASAGKFRLGCYTINEDRAMVPVDLSLNTPYGLVLRYNITNFTTTLWIDPSSESDAALKAESVYDSSLSQSVGHFGFKQMADYENAEHTMGSLLVDNVFVGRSFKDVALPSVITRLQPVGANLLIEAEGLPTTNYVLQTSLSVSGDEWMSIATNSATGKGVLQYEAVRTPDPARFYRLVTP